MIHVLDQVFVLSTNHTTYAFMVTDTLHLEHLYYDRKVTINSPQGLTLQHAFMPGNTNAYDENHKEFSLENMCLEMSSHGKGDIWEPFVTVKHADGSVTSDFLYDSYTILDGKEEYQTLPGSYGLEGEVEHLCVTLKDKGYNLTLELHYYVYADCDVICRSAKLINNSEENVVVERLMSTQLDFHTNGMMVSTFNGAWTREMNRTDTRVSAGTFVNSSCTGTSSSRSNPFIMVSEESATEDNGRCYGLNLIYSGNHYEAVQATSYGKTRVVTGINPAYFSYTLEPAMSLEAPEAVMTFSYKGFNAMSQNMHQFVRQHIVRGHWQYKNRPVLLNSWEASYFDINERKLLNLAKAGKEVGIDLFVMDDGWFGERNDDSHSLGDWDANTKKLPGGVKRLCDKINEMGMDFGIWVEPEMINVNSNLYKEHPEWAIDIPDHAHSEGRNQRILDLTNNEVQDYVIAAMSKVFASANITYVKWDMNRTFTDYYSKNLPNDRQGEVAHRYVMGLYRVMKELTTRFPQILYEGCSAGGNRFDLGILCYFPQIWASDNTDALCRADIQTGYSYGYPSSVIGAHVSGCPNHQTLRTTPLETRFSVAAYGLLGYECNLCDMKKEELESIKEQIALYKEWRDVLQWGNFYRGRNFKNGNITEWTAVSKDKSRAVGMLLQGLTRANHSDEYYKANGLDEEKIYHFYNIERKYNIKEFGDLINSVAPIHVKQDSLIHNTIAKFVKMDGEKEDYHINGGVLMYNGVRLKQAFTATGYNDQVRYFPDYASRLYFMEG